MNSSFNTIALRFSDNYAPIEGTIFHHQKIIAEEGYVWFGKFGSNVSKKIIEEQLKCDDPKFLLIKSGELIDIGCILKILKLIMILIFHLFHNIIEIMQKK